MYRRPLQFAARSFAHVSACRAASAGGKGLDQEACFRALAACQQAGVSSPLVTPCRTLHVATQIKPPSETHRSQNNPTEMLAVDKRSPLGESLFQLKAAEPARCCGYRVTTSDVMFLFPQKIKIAALRMYTCCVERINYDEFFDKCTLPDTLNSWFLVAQLHVWMCLVRMRQEGREGKYMCRYIVHSMWEDVEQRSKIMGIDAIHRKEAMKAMTETFYAAIFGYDEGILSDDTVLAAALWRNLFNRQCEDPRQLELMVEYVRKQMQYIDALDGDDLLLTGEVKWRPLVEENAQSILKVVKPTYNDAGL
ncbi:ubiquinol-cytochrome-c reductase complex assembly factor 1 [Neolamprologus brichardi]|uniref:ubiquinol-cytochrome-c reductase complex assembly factor 1 n=1 Tax=Neolamprologus brichardi TaxID=32507 RepID=UPI001643B6E7|nr:ubiquinol-cytochrome-c reductase complex assembly factor 1 [Neolamprologus brichardi]